MVLLIFFIGTLLGVLAGGTLCVHYLRSAVTDDIGPKLRRMHADIDPQLRRMQNQLDLIESAVNLALATRYAELASSPSRPPAIPAPRANGEGQPRPSRAGTSGPGTAPDYGFPGAEF